MLREPARHEALARDALLEITPADGIGAFLGEKPGEDGVVEVRFDSARDAYRGWTWVVSIAEIEDGGEPTVLELGLLPAEGALIAPDWVPWSVRLAEWEAQQAVLAAEGGDADDLEDADDEDVDEDADDEDVDEDADLDEDADDESFDDDESLDDDEDLDDDLDADDDLDDSDEDGDDLDDDLDDDEDPDALDEDDDFSDDVDDEDPGIRSTHSGDIDGIDIDAIAPDSEEE